jgi:hypothetical protein
MPAMTPEALRQAGLDALRRELGVVGMVRFLQQFEMGQGDYTHDRWQWLTEGEDIGTLIKEIDEKRDGS